MGTAILGTPESQTHEGMASLLSTAPHEAQRNGKAFLGDQVGALAAFSKNIHLSSRVFPAKDCSPTETASVETHEICHLGLDAINSAFTFIWV